MGTEVLAEIGHSHWFAGAHPAEVSSKERAVLGPVTSGSTCTLGLVGVTGSPQQCWDVLSRRTVALAVAGGELRVLDLGARMMHLALHAAQNGPAT